MASRLYKINRLNHHTTGQTQYRLTVPHDVAELIPDDVRFEFVVTERGFEYIAHKINEQQPVEKPPWA